MFETPPQKEGHNANPIETSKKWSTDMIIWGDLIETEVECKRVQNGKLKSKVGMFTC